MQIFIVYACDYFYSLRKFKKKKNFASAHSMEEAEVLCDRLGIFVDGSFQCLGNPTEVSRKYQFVYDDKFLFQKLHLYGDCSLTNKD